MRINGSRHPVKQAMRVVCLMLFAALMSSICLTEVQAQKKKSKKQQKTQQ